MKDLLSTGIELVIVSMGADGAVFMDKSGAVRSFPFEIDVKSTVGAGDSMVGATVYSVLNGFSLEKTAKIATAAGTLTSSKEGTQFCSADEITNTLRKG